MDESKMSRDDIIRMAGESWLTEYGVKELAFGRDVEIDIEALEHFADLVAAAEREEILKLCEPPENSHQYVHTFKKIIRARGQA